jgi:hypothetical protein
VATTRARDVLVVSRWVHEDGRVTPAWEGLLPFLGDVQELPWEVGEEQVNQEYAGQIVPYAQHWSEVTGEEVTTPESFE